MNRIDKVAVLGAGVMGASIAAHLANAGLKVLLLDIVPDTLTEAENNLGLTLNDAAVRNRYAAKGLHDVIKSRPAAFYLSNYSTLVETGNFDDDMARIGDCDWVLEVVVENIDIKKKLLTEKIAPNLKEGAVISSNTSGLSVNEMAKALPGDLQKRFMVTHFFNPPRYMRLLEIVPCDQTDPATVEFMSGFLSERVGKGIVYAKDTPNFIANRIGVYSISNCIRHMLDMGLTVEEVDTIAGVATARPRSAAFRTSDLVGVDTMARVCENSYNTLVDDEEREIFRVPDIVQKMVRDGLLGEKTGKGFYRKDKVEGKSVISYYDYNAGEYKPSEKPKFASVQGSKMVDDPQARLRGVITSDDKAGLFAWKNIRDTLIYTARRIPEISDDVVNIDNAMRWGYNWEIGPFEMFDAVGVPYFVKRATEDGVEIPEFLRNVETFYKIENGKKYYYDVVGGGYKDVRAPRDQVGLEIIKRSGGVAEKNAGCSVVDIGDGVFCLEFHSKMNTIGGDILDMTPKAVKRAEAEGVGLVIGNEGALFSAGANLMLLAVAMAEGEYDDINIMIRAFQRATMTLKYSRVPVVSAPFNMALGGGCEFALASDAINAHAEVYMGLVEVGVGLLPAGGGTKEMAMRSIAMANKYSTDAAPYIFKYFQNIGMAKVSTSAAELFEMGYMRRGDSVTMDRARLISDAKAKVVSMARSYRPSEPAENLKAPGRGVAASLKSQLWNMRMGRFVTEYEEVIGGAIAHAITGGDVAAGALISEKYLLELEREAFLKLCGNRKTLERVQHMLKKGKPLRN